MMVSYQCDPALELNGQTARALLENINRDAILPHLEMYGLDDIDPDAWYPTQHILEVMSAIAHEGNAMSHFVAIGIKAAELSPLTPELEQLPFDAFIRRYAEIYRVRHRNGDPGTIQVTEAGDNHITLVFNVPYPDDVMYGLVFGYARRLFPPDVHFTVYYDEDVPARDAGGEETIIHVTWDV